MDVQFDRHCPTTQFHVVRDARNGGMEGFPGTGGDRERDLLAGLHFSHVSFGHGNDESQMIGIHNLHNGHRP